MFLIIAAWIYYFLLALTIGSGLLRLISRAGGEHLTLHFDVFYKFWFGFVIIIGLLQALSFFLPMGNTTFLIVSLLALLIGLINAKSVQRKLILLWQRLSTLKGTLSLVITTLIVCIVAYSANREVMHADTFLYHFNAVKWVKEYSVVPGLANLHSRLGFNSSFFLFAAFTEIGPLANQSAHVALSFLMTVCLTHWFFVISRPQESMLKKIFCMMTSVFLVFNTMSQINITSLSTDYPMAILTLIFCLVLVDRIPNKILLLLPLSAVIFSFKLSGMLAIGAALVLFLGFIVFTKYSNQNKEAKKAEIRGLKISFVLFSIILLGFVGRNIIVSGWLVYPFPIGNLNLPWSIPKPYVLDMIAWIKSYPKIPGGASPATIEGHNFFFWFNQWYNKFKQSMEFDMFFIALIILAGTAFSIRSLKRFIYARLNIILLILFSAASIGLWFISAPELRFGSVYFYIFFASTTVLLYEAVAPKNVLRIFYYALFVVMFIYRIPSFTVYGAPKIFTFPPTKSIALKRVIASPADENPPLYIYMPLKGGSCGNSPLPCTPYAGGYLDNHRSIRQRVPGNLSKGFLPTEEIK